MLNLHNKEFGLGGIFFAHYKEIDKKEKSLEDEKDEIILQNVLLDIKNKYGKNSILRGISYDQSATQMKRNCMVGGHNAE